jgi:hypothetical protein
MRRWHHLPTLLLVATTVTLLSGGTAWAQGDPDPCALLSTDTVTDVLGAPSAEPLGDGATWCNWAGELTTLSVVVDASGFDALVTSYPGGEDEDVGDARGYQFGSAGDGFSQASVIAPLGERALMLTVASTDPDVDASGTALALATAALGGDGAGPAQAGSGSAEPAATPAFVLWCDGFTEEEVSNAIGRQVTASPNTTIADSCAWISGTDGPQVGIELNRLDAATIADLAASFGGTPVEELVPEPADAAWWAADYDVLHVLAGDVAFHVFIGSGGEMDDTTARAMAMAVAAAFLAEP